MINDCLHIKGLTFHAFHGVNPAEAELGQKFIIDVDLYLRPTEYAPADDLSVTVNYAHVARAVKWRVTENKYRLIETLAEQIAVDLLGSFDCAAARVTVHKPGAPLKENFADVSAEVYRAREKNADGAINDAV
ncbi:MAG: dihydroneopterin aldolase [Gracilibacteraceae bacterium]|jgi:dihydroneopterin aldolase|nr:dihydroneopterin aldolase [Gracilibacteraceae bacterium]